MWVLYYTTVNFLQNRLFSCFQLVEGFSLNSDDPSLCCQWDEFLILKMFPFSVFHIMKNISNPAILFFQYVCYVFLAADPQYQCNLCDQKFHLKTTLKSHMQWRHSDTRGFTCDLCQRAFKSRAMLNRHKNTKHSDVRKYMCDCELKLLILHVLSLCWETMRLVTSVC